MNTVPLDHKYTATVTIGRNIGGEPMEAYRWASFTMKAARVVTTRGLTVYTSRAAGLGSFTGENGVTIREESCTWVYELEEAAVKATIALLHDLAVEYGQESIALVLGTTVFC